MHKHAIYILPPPHNSNPCEFKRYCYLGGANSSFPLKYLGKVWLPNANYGLFISEFPRVFIKNADS